MSTHLAGADRHIVKAKAQIASQLLMLTRILADGGGSSYGGVDAPYTQAPYTQKESLRVFEKYAELILEQLKRRPDPNQ
jgi:hypothetical protein